MCRHGSFHYAVPVRRSDGYASDAGRARLTLRFCNHVIDDMAVFMLWAEHDDFCVSIDLHIVPRRPVEQIVGLHGLLLAGHVGRGELAA